MVAFLASLLGGLSVFEDGKLTPRAASHHDRTFHNGPQPDRRSRVCSLYRSELRRQRAPLDRMGGAGDDASAIQS
jgi:hypothetical protein